MIARGIAAKALLEDETLQYVLDSILAEQFATFISSHADEAVHREKVWATVQGLELVRSKINALISTGKMEETNKKYDEQS
jgi:hypothetical protein